MFSSISTASIRLVFFANAKYIVGVTYRVKNVDIIIPPKIVAPTANLDPSPAPGPIFPITKGIIAIIVLNDVIIIGLILSLQACKLRIRPIIMTSLSTMIAMIPLVIGNIGPGAGEGSRLAVGATILGGMIISTFFTLYVTPTMYLALAKNTKRIDAVDIELNKQLN